MNATKTIILGIGCAGITVSYELLNKTKISILAIDKNNVPGGLAKNHYHNNNIIDFGGHRFFSKNKEIIDIWQNFLSIQSDTISSYENNCLLIRTRKSRIIYKNNYFNYPLSINIRSINELGLLETIKCFFSYCKYKIIPINNCNLENFYINRFGKRLYDIFFKAYTTKLWGVEPKEISSEWGKQRVRGLSLFKTIKNKHNSKYDSSLETKFLYPKYGPGSIYSKMAKWCKDKGAKFLYNTKIERINIKNNKVESVLLNDKTIKCNNIFSSIPIDELITIINDDNLTDEVKDIASNLPYRNLINVNLLLKDLNIHNETKEKSINNRILDTWLYIQDPNLHIARVQILNNWSPYLAKDNINTTWIGLEIFTDSKSKEWHMKDNELIELAIKEGISINLFSRENIIDSCVNKIEKAYPSYTGVYNKFHIVKDYLNKIDGLYCIGRNGQHRYNNMDHSMLTAIKAVELMINKDKNKESLWEINTKQEYNEAK